MELKKNNHSLQIYIYIRFSRFLYIERIRDTNGSMLVIEREERWRNRKWIKSANSETSGAENVKRSNRNRENSE